MDKNRMDKHIDNAAEQAKEAMDTLSGMVDRATQCADETATKVKNRVQEGATKASNRIKEGTMKATDRVEEAVTAAANRVREKVK